MKKTSIPEPLKVAGRRSEVEVQSLNHSSWVCNYHVIWIPKYRKKSIFKWIRVELGEILHKLAEQRESKIMEGHLLADHVHILISIPPKYSVSSVIGYIKGKSALHIERRYSGKRRNFGGESFWARGYYVSTVGLDEETIRNYIRNQEEEDRRIDQLSLV